MKVIVDTQTGTVIYPEFAYIIEADDIEDDTWNEMSDSELAEYALQNGIKVL